MKHFIQQNTIKTLLKTSLGLILFFLVIQQGFGQQCVQCNGTTTSGTYPSAIGGGTTATGNYSLAGGLFSSAKGDASFAFGNRVEVDGTSSVGIGQFVRTNGLTSAIIGAGFDINYPLINTNEFSLVIGFKSTKPTFFVGKSTGVNNTGKIGIGNVTDPQAKLHIRADDGEDASLRLEPTGSTKNAVVYFTNSGHAVKAKTGGHLTFATQSTKGFVFEAGNVGIGVATPAEKLDIAGNIKQSAGSSLTTTTVKAADANGLKLYNSSGSGMFVAANGSVGIGTTNTLDYMLAVAGKVVATEVFVKHIDNWYDHVFSESYDLMSIHALERYVKENKHLPDMPSEKDVSSDGIQLGSIAGLLLKKIEELTLYTIEQQKLIEEQQKVLERVLETLEKEKSKQ